MTTSLATAAMSLGGKLGMPRVVSRDNHPLRRKQAQSPLGTRRQHVDIAARGLVVGGLHDGRGRRYDPQVAALTYPVSMAMAVHHDRPAAQALQAADEPAAVD